MGNYIYNKWSNYKLISFKGTVIKQWWSKLIWGYVIM